MNRASFPQACRHAGLLVLGILASLGAADVHADGKLLRWKLQPGEKFHVTFTQQTVQATTVNNKPVKTSIDMTMEMDWVVDDVQPDGQAQLTQSFTRMKIAMNAGGAEPIQFDSADEQRPEGPAADIRRAVRRLLGAPFHITLNARGEILDVTLSDEAAQAIEQSTASDNLKQLLTPDGLRQMLRQSSVVLPEKSIAAGATWNEQVESASPLGTLKLRHEYRYAGSEERDGRLLEKITVETKFELIKPSAAPRSKLTIKSQSQTGTLYFDAAAGRFVDAETKQQLATETPYRDLLIQATVDSTLRMDIAPAN